MAKMQYEVKVSVMDSEPMDELVTMICSWDRDKLPPEYKDQLEAWAHKFLKEDDNETEVQAK